MSDFYSKLGQTQDNVSITENGAVGYKTTTHALADFNFKVSSYRSQPEKAIQDFNKVLSEGETYILKYLFYLRDAREGIGERDLFRNCLARLVEVEFEDKDNVINTILTQTPEYGRWDDLWVFLGTKYEIKVVEMVKSQLKADMTALHNKEASISLLGKWMPSENTSSKVTKNQARILRTALGATPRQYRKMLSTLRSHLNIVENKTCAKEWGDIDYNTVPSKANLKYANAFLRNDETRRRQYLSDLNRGVDKDGNVVKINSTVNTPHDVLHMYNKGTYYYDISLKGYDEAIEQLWKNLKDVPGLKDTIVVRDDSGSMESPIGNTKITAYEVATALGIYCAEHNSPAYKNKIITFSETPRYLDFSDEQKFGSLHSKYEFLLKHSEVANTNVEAVFDLILKTAVENKLKAEDLPAQILIISDMEFDGCACTNALRSHGWGYRGDTGVNISLFSNIAAKYAQYGYKLPKLVFWNVNSRTGTIPCKQNEAGVILVSGFSQNVLSLVNSGKTDPYEALIDELNKPRYEPIPLITYKLPEAVETKTYSVRKKKAEKVDVPDFLK